VLEWNPEARAITYGQELNPESCAIAKADMMIKGYDHKNITFGNTLSDDQLPYERFGYCLANPPFGVDWKKVQKAITDEHKHGGRNGRFGPGLPRVSDGSLLFLMHLLSKRRHDETGTRIGIILNVSPLFTGGAGSGESEIRRWILENDWLEAIVALPTDLFYNTGIATYVWVLTNRKEKRREGRAQLINATALRAPMRKSLGSKRRYLTEEHIGEIARQLDVFKEGETCPQAITCDLALSIPHRLDAKVTFPDPERAGGVRSREMYPGILGTLEVRGREVERSDRPRASAGDDTAEDCRLR